VVAKEDAHGPPLAPAPRGVDHTAAVWAATHQVFEKNDRRLRRRTRAVVNVADRKDAGRMQAAWEREGPAPRDYFMFSSWPYKSSMTLSALFTSE
jgi:hypothetical protein